MESHPSSIAAWDERRKAIQQAWTAWDERWKVLPTSMGWQGGIERWKVFQPTWEAEDKRNACCQTLVPHLEEKSVELINLAGPGFILSQMDREIESFLHVK